MRGEKVSVSPFEKAVRGVAGCAASYNPGGVVLNDHFIAHLDSLSGEELHRLSWVVDENRVVVPVYEALNLHDSPAASALRDLLEPVVHRVVERGRCRDRLLGRLVNVLDDHGIEYAVFKTLSRLGSVGVDIDVIIEPMSYEVCIGALLADDFISIDDLSKRYATGFMVEGNPIVVDLHTELAVLGVRYMSSDLLLGRKRRVMVQPCDSSGCFALNVPDEAVDALVRIAHCVLKEGTISMDDVAETSYVLAGNLDLLVSYMDEENLRLTGSIFSYAALQTLSVEQFKPLIMFEEDLTHNLAKNILANSITTTIPPVKLPVATCMLAFLDSLRGKGEISMCMPRLIRNIGFRRNAAHLGRRILESLFR